MADDARGVLDRSWALHVEVDDQTPLWDSRVEQLERWPSSSVAHTEAARARLLAVRAEALAAEEEAADLAPSLRTAADAALLEAASLDVVREQVLPHPDIGLHSFLFWAVNNFPLVTPDHGSRYLDKLTALPGAVDELVERLTVAAAGGRAPIARHSRRAVEKLEAHLESAVADDPLMAQAPPTQLDDAAAARWRDHLAAAIEQSVRPALGHLRTTLRDVSLPAGRDDRACGLGHVPGGAATYATLLEACTAEGLSPERVHAVGVERLERLAGEYADLGGRVFGLHEPSEVLRRMRDDASLQYTTPDEVVAAATRLHARAERVAPDWFARTPDAACEVRAVGQGSLAFYSRPTADGSRPGVFFLNTAEPRVWGANLASTVFHEGIPGHHFQLALAVEDADLHAMHRDLFLPAFGEGWALYAERLADEIGLFTSDVERLGMLANDSLRAARLVVDTGMHAFGWSRRDAVEHMVAHTPLHVAEITAEVDRYIGMPGQAASYMLGRLEIERLRRESAARLGAAFDLRAFHATVLSRGMLSLPALRMVVDAWDGTVDSPA